MLSPRKVLRRLPVSLPVAVNGTDRMWLPARQRGLRRYEPDSWHRFLSLVENGSTFLDVGANVGLYAVAAAKRGAAVVALEPDAKNARSLRRNARRNRVRVRVVEAAAGDTDGAVLLAERGNPVSGTVDLYLGPTTRYRIAPMIRIDSLKGVAPDLVKIDVEGAELAVLQGAEQMLRERRPRAILLEVHPSGMALRGQTAADLTAFLAGCGYQHEFLGTDGPERWLVTPSS